MEFDKVSDVIAELMNIEKETITEATLFEDLGADSLDVFQIISELEEIYDMEFDTDDAVKIKTVGDAVNYIKTALGK